jgi:lincosamide nucleotidyltransferase A/C/D/E
VKTTEMTASGLTNLLTLIDDASIPVWLDGGWGIDALVETQTRPHKDVDLIVARTDSDRLIKLLNDHGFRLNYGGRADNFVLADDAGREVDIHVVEFDADGNGIYLMENGDRWIFPAHGFTGRGRVEGVEVQCLSPEVAVECHANGYSPQEKDFADMELLARRFGVVVPPNLLRPTEPST